MVLFYFIQGGLPSTAEVWKEHVLSHSTMKQLGFESPDVFFAVDDIDNDGVLDIPAAIFFHNGNQHVVS